jgi:hypothetical protein
MSTLDAIGVGVLAWVGYLVTGYLLVVPHMITATVRRKSAWYSRQYSSPTREQIARFREHASRDWAIYAVAWGPWLILTGITRGLRTAISAGAAGVRHRSPLTERERQDELDLAKARLEEEKRKMERRIKELERSELGVTEERPASRASDPIRDTYQRAYDRTRNMTTAERAAFQRELHKMDIRRAAGLDLEPDEDWEADR